MWLVCIESHMVGHDDNSRYLPKGEIVDAYIYDNKYGRIGDDIIIEIHYEGYLYSDMMKYFITQLEWDRMNKINQILS